MCEDTGTPHPHGAGLLVRMWNDAEEKSLEISQKDKHRITIWPRLPFPGDSQNNWKDPDRSSVHCSIIHNSQRANIRKGATDDWINKMWYIPKMKYNPAIKRSEALTHAITWRKPKDIVLSEISQTSGTNTMGEILYDSTNTEYIE